MSGKGLRVSVRKMFTILLLLRNYVIGTKQTLLHHNDFTDQSSGVSKNYIKGLVDISFSYIT